MVLKSSASRSLMRVPSAALFEAALSQLFASRTKVSRCGGSLLSDIVLIQFLRGKGLSRSKWSPKAFFNLRLALYLRWTTPPNRALVTS